jgi:hypothetical protein
MGQLTLMVTAPRRTSMSMVASSDVVTDTGTNGRQVAGAFTADGIAWACNAVAAASRRSRSSLRHPCTRLAFTP